MTKSILLTWSSVCFCILNGFFNSALALDPPPKHNTSFNTYTLNADLKPIPSDSYQIAKATFLPDAAESLFSGKTTAYDYNDKNYNKAGTCNDKSSLYTTRNCSYPRAVLASSQCPFLPGYYTQCKCLPQFKLTSCNSPYILGGGSCDGKYAACVCPSPVSLTNPNDRCSKYCDGKCIEKTCSPTADQSGCTNGTYNCSNGCGANTRKCCVACTHKITSKPSNSTYTYSSCYDGTTKQIQTDWYCNSGYHQKGNSCEAHSYSCPSGYSTSSSGMISPVSTAKVCSCGLTSGTCYRESHTHSYSCPSGYSDSNSGMISPISRAKACSCGATSSTCYKEGHTHSYSCPSGYQESACSSNQTQTGTTSKKCSCGKTNGTCYACRAKTCEEKGQKTCNGSCIATSECCGGCASNQKCSNGTCVAKSCSEQGLKDCNGGCIATSACCGGCPSGQKCENGSCVDDKYLISIVLSLNGPTASNYNIGLNSAGCPIDKKPLQGITAVSGSTYKNISLYPKCRSLGGSTNFSENTYCYGTTCTFSFIVAPGTTVTVSTYGDLYFQCGYPTVKDNFGNTNFGAEDKQLTPTASTTYYFDFNCTY